MEPRLFSLLPSLKHPIIMAPMFLVSNVEMVTSATKAGIAGCIPALNFRTTEELKVALKTMKEQCKGPFGINLIVNKSNFKLDEQLEACCETPPDFIITSLGSPKKIVEEGHKVGIKVFCDVTDLEYAKKVEAVGADALIAVNKRAGGHAGRQDASSLINTLKSNCKIPVISAGGVGNHSGYKEVMGYGADGLSIGSVFIASKECGVSDEYKQACVTYGQEDIVMTTKLSGTPCTVINTPYVKKIGTKQNALERLLNKNKRLKKWMKALTFYQGMKSLEKSAFSATYKTVWCAGPSIEHVKKIRTIEEIVQDLTQESHG